MKPTIKSKKKGKTKKRKIVPTGKRKWTDVELADMILESYEEAFYGDEYDGRYFYYNEEF